MSIIKSVSMTLSSPVLTGLNRVDDIVIGLNVFGSGVPVGTQTLSIDTALKTITLTNNATLTQTASLEFTTMSRDVYLESKNVLKDVWNVMQERGGLVIFENRIETDITRDTYNSISKRNITTTTHLNFRAFPIDFQPSSKKLEKAGIKEQCNVLIYTSMLDWNNYGINFNDIEITTRNTVKLLGNDYEIKEKGLFGQFNDMFVYITFALNKD